jgi:hypothetical protein
MSEPQISQQEKHLIIGSWLPDIPFGDMTPRSMQQLTDAIWESSAPLASYALNRVGTWLDGSKPFNGDETFDVAWSSGETKLTVFKNKGRGAEPDRICTLTRKADGARWEVKWAKAKYRDVPEISLSRVSDDGNLIEICNGEITTGEPGTGNRHGFSNCPPPVRGSVEGFVRLGAFDDLVEFCSAVRPSMPDTLFNVSLEKTATFAHLQRLEELMLLLAADGGLPGRLCKRREDMVVRIANASAAKWMQTQYAPLIAGLRERGAEWGKGLIAYNDADYRCCLVDFDDGTIGLFSDNAATCSDERSYVARLNMKDGAVTGVEVHLLRDAEASYADEIAAIGARAASPDFVHDYESRSVSFPGGRDGWIAMNMFLWQSMADSTYALDDGKIETDSYFWRSSSRNEMTS